MVSSRVTCVTRQAGVIREVFFEDRGSQGHGGQARLDSTAVIAVADGDVGERLLHGEDCPQVHVGVLGRILAGAM